MKVQKLSPGNHNIRKVYQNVKSDNPAYLLILQNFDIGFCWHTSPFPFPACRQPGGLLKSFRGQPGNAFAVFAASLSSLQLKVNYETTSG